MVIMKKILFISFCLLGIISCKPDGRIYENHKELSPMVEWLKKDVLSYEVEVEDTTVSYDLSLALRYVTGYQYPTLLVSIEIISPNREVEVLPVELTVANSDGTYKGEPGFDIWDYEEKVIEGINFKETGVYTFKITQNMPEDPLNFAMELGLIIDKNAL